MNNSSAQFLNSIFEHSPADGSSGTRRSPADGSSGTRRSPADGSSGTR